MLTCDLCNSRYQGVTRLKGKKCDNGTRVKTSSYGCGGYITKGKAICQMNPIAQELLETRVIDTVLEYYHPYLEKEGRKKMAKRVKSQVGNEGEDISAYRKRS